MSPSASTAVSPPAHSAPPGPDVLSTDAPVRSAGRFAAVFDHLLEGCQVVGHDWRYLYLNDAAARHGRRAKEELLGLALTDAYPGIEDSSLFAAMLRCARELAPVQMLNEFTYPDGTQGWFELRLQPIPEGIFILSIDVTERHQMQEALRASEQAYRLLMNHAPDAIWILDSDGLILDANERACALTGFAKTYLIGRYLTELHAPEHEGDVGAKIAAAAHGEHVVAVWPIRRKDGALVQVEVSAKPLPDGRVQAIARDVTERRQAEVQRRRHERQLHAILEAVNDIVFEFDEDGTYLSVWAADATRLVAPREEILGRTASDVLGEATARPFVERFRRVLRTGSSERLEYSLALADGEHRFFSQINRLPGVDGEPDTVCMGISDITDLYHAEAALRENERRLRTLAETVDLIVLGLDATGCVEYVNPFLLRLTGYPLEEVAGRSWMEMFVPETLRPEVNGVFSELLNSESHPHYQSPILTRSGEERMIAWSNTVMRDTRGQAIGTLSIGEDVTERIRLEEQYRQALKMEAVGQLAGGLAHDFNNILTVISGYTDLVREELPEGDARRADLDEVWQATRRASTLTRQLLAFSRRQVLQPRALDVNEVVTSLEKMLGRIIGEDVRLEASLSPDLARVLADQGQLEQVVVNLAVNARDAMLGGGRLIIETRNAELHATDRVEGWELVPGPYVLLSITDTGHGMDEETLAHAFEPFFTTKEPGKGTGLGLATVYGIVAQSGGHVSVYSAPGEGTRVDVYLPAVDRRPEHAGPAA